MMDERFKEWIKELLSYNGINSIDQLTPDMIIGEIRDTESSIESEEYWENGSTGSTAAMHRNNAVNYRDYILFLEELIPDMHTLELILGMYEDPDELPKRVIFLIPNSLDLAELKAILVTTRDKVLQEYPDLCVEEAFEQVLKETCAAIGPHCHRRYESLARLHGKENLWGM